MSGFSLWHQILIGMNMFFADNSKALTVHVRVRPDPPMSTAIAIRRQEIPTHFQKRSRVYRQPQLVTTPGSNSKSDSVNEESRKKQVPKRECNTENQPPLGPVHFDYQQVKSKWSHSIDFGVKGNCNPRQIAKYQGVLQRHKDNLGNLVIKGTYGPERWRIQVYHCLDPRSMVNVMFDLNGNYISGWRLSNDQYKNVITRGSL